MLEQTDTKFETIRKMAEYIRKRFKPEKIILFGSYAYGEPVKGSDIDLLVIMNTSLPIREQAFLIRREINTTVPVDIVVRTPKQVEERIKLGDFFMKKIIEKGMSL